MGIIQYTAPVQGAGGSWSSAVDYLIAGDSGLCRWFCTLPHCSGQ